MSLSEISKNSELSEAFTQAQLILAEKRTSLAVLRTAIMIFALPLTILTALIALSKYYEFTSNIWLLIPIVTVSTLLFAIAVFLIYRSVRNILKYDNLLQEIRSCNPEVKKFIPSADTGIRKKD